MGVPKSRHTSSKKRRRRAHIFVEAPSLVSCPKCGRENLPHIACQNCGYYKGREVLPVLGKLEKKERKRREKEIKEVKKEEKPLSVKELSKK